MSEINARIMNGDVCQVSCRMMSDVVLVGVNFDGVPLVTGNGGPDEITPNQPFTPGSLRNA